MRKQGKIYFGTFKPGTLVALDPHKMSKWSESWNNISLYKTCRNYKNSSAWYEAVQAVGELRNSEVAIVIKTSFPSDNWRDNPAGVYETELITSRGVHGWCWYDLLQDVGEVE